MTFTILKREVAVQDPDGILINTPEDGSPETVQDTVMCVHCNRHWVLGRAVKEALRGKMGFCKRCNGITCPGEKCNRECIPIERMLLNKEGHDPTAVTQGGHFNGSIWLP